MKLSDFDYDYEPSMIAQRPLESRTDSRLLVVDRKNRDLTDSRFQDLYSFMEPGSLMVVNNTMVYPARLIGRKKSGGRVEIFLLRRHEENIWSCLVGGANKMKKDTVVYFAEDFRARITGKDDEAFIVEFSWDRGNFEDLVGLHGSTPLPPYIKREADREDLERYQTVFAKHRGSVAAPTAGLHFSPDFLAKAGERGITVLEVTLHVGLGTFRPIKVQDIEDHAMHSEKYAISSETADALNRAREEGRKVYAVGTTVVRTLESAFQNGNVGWGEGETSLFIFPGYDFRVVDGMVTNFHQPKSSLFVMVSAFAGTGLMRSAYAHAIREKYRLFSYGDATLLK